MIAKVKTIVTILIWIFLVFQIFNTSRYYFGMIMCTADSGHTGHTQILLLILTGFYPYAFTICATGAYLLRFRFAGGALRFSVPLLLILITAFLFTINSGKHCAGSFPLLGLAASPERVLFSLVPRFYSYDGIILATVVGISLSAVLVSLLRKPA